eukprot:NODE_8_length_47770_cov_0.334354.p7 type:complete len:387 gc:universal NODE_8_length_47770_cov_0.334354:11540-10380(-)
MEQMSLTDAKAKLEDLRIQWKEFEECIPPKSSDDNTEDVLMRLVASALRSTDLNARHLDMLVHFKDPKISVTIDVYIEDYKLWVQFRMGYIHSSYKNEDDKDFNKFINSKSNNPYVSSDGKKVNFKDFVLTQPGEENQRFGCDFLIGDVGLDFVWELIDDLLMSDFPRKSLSNEFSTCKAKNCQYPIVSFDNAPTPPHQHMIDELYDEFIEHCTTLCPDIKLEGENPLILQSPKIEVVDPIQAKNFIGYAMCYPHKFTLRCKIGELKCDDVGIPNLTLALATEKSNGTDGLLLSVHMPLMDCDEDCDGHCYVEYQIQWLQFKVKMGQYHHVQTLMDRDPDVVLNFENWSAELILKGMRAFDEQLEESEELSESIIAVFEKMELGKE